MEEDYQQPTTLDDVTEKLDSIENEILLLGEKRGGDYKGHDGMLFVVLVLVIYIAYKVHGF